MTSSQILKKNFQASIEAKQAFLSQTNEHQIFEMAAQAVLDAYKNGGRIYIAGNGGSAADAQHLAAEFVSRLERDRGPIAAEALTVDSSILTAIGNDYGYDQVFSRQVAGKMSPKDIFLGITTSGKSPNILRALQECRARSIKTIIFTGYEGGSAKELADFTIIASGSKTATIQELHIVLAHSLCEYLETEIFKI
jgi:D-sedoheptulose 7-phosphate isomerase